MSKRIGTLLLAFSVAALASCASTTLQSAWYDTSFGGGPFKRILIVGVGTSVTDTRLFEDIFAQQLSAAGTQGVPGYQFIDDDARISDADWNAGVARSGADGLLVVRVLGVDTRAQVSTVMVPRSMYFGPGFGGWAAPPMVAVPQVSQYDIATVEARLFDVRSKTIVWSATTQTLNPTTVARETPGFAAVVIGQLAARKLIAAPVE
jgi:hypothetical protein